MNVNDRVKTVRNALGLTQIEFGSKTGISQGHLTSLENGKRAVTEKTLKVICVTYGINEEWLRTGEGEMFIENDDSILSSLVTKYGLDGVDTKILETYIKLPENCRHAVKDFICALAKAISEDQASGLSDFKPAIAPPALNNDLDIEAEVESYRRELEAEKEVAEKSEATQNSKEA